MALDDIQMRVFHDLPPEEQTTFVNLARARNAVRNAKSEVARAERSLAAARDSLEKAEAAFAKASDEAFNKAKLGATP